MKNQPELRKEAEYSVSKWSGGTTTELGIAPEGSAYADRAFDWRLSSATVELEESTFTPLPAYDRIIMTLEGTVRLKHNDAPWLTLPPFTPHRFDGADETRSEGRVTDFNLMLRKGRCTGFVLPFRMQAGERADIRGALLSLPEALREEAPKQESGTAAGKAARRQGDAAAEEAADKESGRGTDMLMIYVYSGSIAFTGAEGEAIQAKEKDTLLLPGGWKDTAWQGRAEKDTAAVIAGVRYL